MDQATEKQICKFIINLTTQKHSLKNNELKRKNIP